MKIEITHAKDDYFDIGLVISIYDDILPIAYRYRIQAEFFYGFRSTMIDIFLWKRT